MGRKDKPRNKYQIRRICCSSLFFSVEDLSKNTGRLPALLADGSCERTEELPPPPHRGAKIV